MEMARYNLRVAIILLVIKWSYCYTNYVMFKGVDFFNNAKDLDDENMFDLYNQTIIKGNTTKILKSEILTDNTEALNNETSTSAPNTKPSVKLKIFKRKCPETEHPISLGTYEVPTQRDIVLFTKRTLLKMFNSYHEKTLLLLKDIKEVTRFAIDLENKCQGKSKITYKNCVKRVNKHCVAFTKDLVSLMEEDKASVNDLMEEITCKISEMKTDPIQIIKTIAMNEATLDFALPSFLTLIGGCSAYCSVYNNSWQALRRPSRHMTDQDLVIKHLLTKKNYIQLIKGSN